MVWFGLLKALTACLALASRMVLPVDAHGYLAHPAARNVQHNSDYCPQCLNAGGADFVRQRGHGLCGDPITDPKPRKHELGGVYATPTRYAARLQQGKVFVARTEFTAFHGGRWSLRLCGKPKQLTQACLDAGLLKRADGKGPFVDATQLAAAFRVPKNATPGKSVLQWTYETANSCVPAGYASPASAQLSACSAPGAPAMEAFWNCADVIVVVD